MCKLGDLLVLFKRQPLCPVGLRFFNFFYANKMMNLHTPSFFAKVSIKYGKRNRKLGIVSNFDGRNDTIMLSTVICVL